MTRSCASSRPSARSATRSRRAPPASPTRCCSRRPVRASMSSPARGAARSTPASDASISPAPTPAPAIATSCATWGAWGPADAPASRCGRSGPTPASEGFWFGRSSPSFLAPRSACCTADSAVSAVERGRASSSQPAATWVAGHGNWFESASKILYLLGALALALNLWRAISFSSLLLRGAQLLSLDVRDRRRDLDNRLARLNQRVAALSAEAEAAAQAGGGRRPARRRKGGVPRARPGFPRRPTRSRGRGASVSGGARRAARQGFLGRRAGPARSSSSTISTPCRRARRSPGSRRRIASSARARSASWRSTRRGSSNRSAVLAKRAAGSTSGCRSSSTCPGATTWTASGSSPGCLRRTDRRRPPAFVAEPATALVEPLSATEATLLTALAPLAAHSPRGAKRFLNAYRLARCSSAPRPVVALMQAVAFADDGRASGDATIGSTAAPANWATSTAPRPWPKRSRRARRQQRRDLDRRCATSGRDRAPLRPLT